MSITKRRLPIFWDRTKFSIVESSEVSNDDIAFVCPACSSNQLPKRVVEIWQRGQFEDHCHTLVSCKKCFRNYAVHHTERHEHHVAL